MYIIPENPSQCIFIELYQDVGSRTFSPSLNHNFIGKEEITVLKKLFKGNRVILKTVMNKQGRLELTFIFISNDGSEEKCYAQIDLKRSLN